MRAGGCLPLAQRSWFRLRSQASARQQYVRWQLSSPSSAQLVQASVTGLGEAAVCALAAVFIYVSAIAAGFGHVAIERRS